MYELLSYTHERDAAVKDTRRAATQEPTQGGQALTLTRLRENDGARGGGGAARARRSLTTHPTIAEGAGDGGQGGDGGSGRFLCEEPCDGKGPPYE